jgi:thioredoxin-like negative regulator of GroEL
MKPEERRQETDEEFLARLALRRKEKLEARNAAWKAKLEAAKPKVTLDVSPKVVEAMRANPESVKIAVKAADETVLVERARLREVIEVVEVDGQGRPRLVRRMDCTTGDVGVMEMVGGYRPPSGVVHEYDPLMALRRQGHE